MKITLEDPDGVPLLIIDEHGHVFIRGIRVPTGDFVRWVEKLAQANVRFTEAQIFALFEED